MKENMILAYLHREAMQGIINGGAWFAKRLIVKRINYINNINLKNHQTMDSEKYLKQYAALEEAAKSEIIELLSNNPTGRYIYFNCDIEEENEAYVDSTIVVMDGNEQVLYICGVGLNDDNQIVVTDSEDEETWFVPDEWTHAYLEMYQFVVDNLKYAKQSPTLDW